MKWIEYTVNEYQTLCTLYTQPLCTLYTHSPSSELAELYPIPITRHFSVQHHISSKRLSIPAPPTESKSGMEDEDFTKLYGRRSLPVGVYAGVPPLEEAPSPVTVHLTYYSSAQNWNISLTFFILPETNQFTLLSPFS